MHHPGFFEKAGPFTLEHIAGHIETTLAGDIEGSREIENVGALQTATERDIAFFDNRKYISQLTSTAAGACILSANDVEHAPPTAATLVTKTPYVAFARALRLFYPDALRSKAAVVRQGAGSGQIHPTARVAESVIIEEGAVVGPDAVVGAGTTVAAGAIVGYRVVLGEECYIGPGAVVIHSILGDRVIIHPGARIGQDGFGFAMGAAGHFKVPQIGSVRIGDDVEVGANSTIDRGTLADTVVGDGTKIDNLVQIGHNVIIGRHCVIVAQSGIAGSAELGDFVVMGAHSGVIGHVKIGSGAQIAGSAHVKNDLEAGARVGGTPARPFKEWAREVAAVRALGRRPGK